MSRIFVRYLGKLKTEIIHLDSATRIVTDAPKDNEGEGTSFSPTDLVAGAYLSCIFTILGIEMKKGRLPKHLSLEGKVTKIMKKNPRKIAALKIEMKIFGGKKLDDTQREYLENLIWATPVPLSINPDIDVKIKIDYS